MKSLLIQTFCLLFLCLGTVRAQQYQLASPNGKLSVTVDAGEALTWQIAHDGTIVLQPSAIALQGRDEKSAKKAITFGKNVKVIRAERKSVESSFPTPLYKKASVEDVYNQLTLKCRGGYSVQCGHPLHFRTEQAVYRPQRNCGLQFRQGLPGICTLHKRQPQR